MFYSNTLAYEEASDPIFKVPNDLENLLKQFDLEALYLHKIKGHPINPNCILVKRVEEHGNVEQRSFTGITKADFIYLNSNVDIIDKLLGNGIIEYYEEFEQWLICSEHVQIESSTKDEYIVDEITKAEIAELFKDSLNKEQIEILILILKNSYNGWRATRCVEQNEQLWQYLLKHGFISSIGPNRAEVQVIPTHFDFPKELHFTKRERLAIIEKFNNSEIALDDLSTLDPMAMTLFDSNVKLITGAKNIKNYKIRLGDEILSFVPKGQNIHTVRTEKPVKLLPETQKVITEFNNPAISYNAEILTIHGLTEEELKKLLEIFKRERVSEGDRNTIIGIFQEAQSLFLRLQLQVVFDSFSRIKERALENDMYQINILKDVYYGGEFDVYQKEHIFTAALTALITNSFEYCFIQEGQINILAKSKLYKSYERTILFHFDPFTSRVILKEKALEDLPKREADSFPDKKNLLNLFNPMRLVSHDLEMTMYLQSSAYLLPDGPNLISKWVSRFREVLGNFISTEYQENQRIASEIEAKRKEQDSVFREELLSFNYSHGKDILIDLVDSKKLIKKHFAVKEMQLFIRDDELRKYIFTVYGDELKEVSDDIEILEKPKSKAELGNPSIFKMDLEMTSFKEDDIELYIVMDGARTDEQENKLIELVHYSVRECLAKSIYSIQNMRDLSTMLYNKRYFNKILKVWYDEYERRAIQDIGLVMFDMDRLKFINDFWGHRIGDDVLYWVSRMILKETQRLNRSKNKKEESAMASRWGGDEFTILTRNLSGSEFEKIAVDIFRAVTETPIELTFYLDKDYPGRDNDFNVNLIAFFYWIMTKDITKAKAKYDEFRNSNLIELIDKYLEYIGKNQSEGESIISELKREIANYSEQLKIENNEIFNSINIRELLVMVFENAEPELNKFKRNLQEKIYIYIKDYKENIESRRMPKRRLIIDSFLKVLEENKDFGEGMYLTLIEKELKKVYMFLGLDEEDVTVVNLLDILELLFEKRDRELISTQSYVRKTIISVMKEFMLRRVSVCLNCDNSEIPWAIELFLELNMDNLITNEDLRKTMINELGTNVITQDFFVSISAGASSSREDVINSREGLSYQADKRACDAKATKRNRLMIGRKVFDHNGI